MESLLGGIRWSYWLYWRRFEIAGMSGDRKRKDAIAFIRGFKSPEDMNRDKPLTSYRGKRPTKMNYDSVSFPLVYDLV